MNKVTHGIHQEEASTQKFWEEQVSLVAAYGVIQNEVSRRVTAI
jgi:hypothetical protein